ncbi:hypothetical protein GIB67_027025, partial [Kingdonia uniflora]
NEAPLPGASAFLADLASGLTPRKLPMSYFDTATLNRRSNSLGVAFEVVIMELLCLNSKKKRVDVCACALVFLLLISFGKFGSEAQVLPEREAYDFGIFRHKYFHDFAVQILQQISTKLKITVWKPAVDSCTTGCLNKNFSDTVFSKVTCDCTYTNNTVCHVTNIQVKGMNLTGALPSEFANLTFLREIDLSRNFLNGSIPTSWFSLPLVTLAVLGNNVVGTIPAEIGGIATLEELIVEDNKFGGSIPPELGKLSRLRRFLGSGNNFTGTLPPELGDLKNLTDFRIDGNPISGKIPDFIGNWTNITKL